LRARLHFQAKRGRWRTAPWLSM